MAILRARSPIPPSTHTARSRGSRAFTAQSTSPKILTLSRSTTSPMNPTRCISLKKISVDILSVEGILVLGGCDALHLTKYPHKILFIREATVKCGFFYGDAIVGQQCLCRFDANLIRIAHNGTACATLKERGKIIRPIAHRLRQLRHIKRLIIVIFYPLSRRDHRRRQFLANALSLKIFLRE